jgi:hypothetical protein
VRSALFLLLGPAALALLTAAHAPPEAPSAPAADALPNVAPTPSDTKPLPAGEVFESDLSLPEHADDVVDYTLHATLDPAMHTVHGEGTIRWRNASTTPVREIWVHLYLNAFKGPNTTFMREDVGGRGSTLPTQWGQIDVRRFVLKDDADANVDLWANAELHRPNDEDETDVRVPLPRDVLPGETITIETAWDDKLPAIVERTGYDGSFHMIAQWFPKIARLEEDGHWAHFPFHHLAEFYADFGTYDVTLDVPEAFTLGATGRAVETKVGGGRRVERHVQEDVHDFAWTAWDKFEMRSEAVGGVAVTVLYPPGYGIAAEREMAAVRFALPHFGERYGYYPYPRLTVVHPPSSAREAGGMEYPTLITTGGPWYGPPGIMALELVTIHEFGHQYFYGLVASNEVAWPFLDEGINSYAEVESMEAWLGPGNVASLGGLKVGNGPVKATTSNLSVHNTKVAQPAFAFPTGGDYGNLVYSRTAAIVDTLRRVYGAQNVARALGRYARRYRFKHPGPEELIAIFEEVLGPRAAANLRTALFDKGWADYTVETVTSRHAEAGDHEGWVLVRRRGTLSFPVAVELTLDDGSTQLAHWDGEGDAVRIPYRGPLALTSAVVDPDHSVMIDADLTNNFGVAAGRSGGGTGRSFERALYYAQLLVQAVSP